jgi:TolB-like protein
MRKAKGFLCMIFLIFSISEISVAQDRIKIAVLYFNNSGEGTTYSNYVEGLPEMLMKSLGKSNKIHMIEKEQIDKAIKHFEIEKSDFLNEPTALKVGKWVSADMIILGNFSEKNKNVRIDAWIVNTESGTLVTSANVQDHLKNLNSLVDNLAGEILNALSRVNKRLKDNKFS